MLWRPSCRPSAASVLVDAALRRTMLLEVPVMANLVATFSEQVVAGTGIIEL